MCIACGTLPEIAIAINSSCVHTLCRTRGPATFRLPITFCATSRHPRMRSWYTASNHPRWETARSTVMWTRITLVPLRIERVVRGPYSLGQSVSWSSCKIKVVLLSSFVSKWYSASLAASVNVGVWSCADSSKSLAEGRLNPRISERTMQSASTLP